VPALTAGAIFKVENVAAELAIKEFHGVLAWGFGRNCLPMSVKENGLDGIGADNAEDVSKFTAAGNNPGQSSGSVTVLASPFEAEFLMQRGE
jgi:hypothetical protein